MGQGTLNSATPEHRRATRVRKVRPIAFVPQTMDAEPSLQTVTANVSRSGMLLVTRRDQFPPAGSGILLMPYELSANAPDSSAAIQGRIVYTRYSPRAQLRFAGLKFEQDLPDRAAHLLGLDGAPDAVTDAITTLEKLELGGTPRATSAAPAFMPLQETPPAIEARPSAPALGTIDLRTELAAERREFFRATAAFLSEWGEARIRKAIEDRHALARAKGPEGLRAMKRDWEQTRRSFSVLVEVEIGQAFDRGPAPNSYYNEKLDQPTAAVLQVLRDLAGRAGQILVEHGFEDTSASGDWVLSHHERGRVSFRGPMPISEAMRESLLRMAAMEKSLNDASGESDAERDSRLRAEALALWDRA